MVWGCQPHAHPPTRRTRVSLFIWLITFDLSGMGGPNSSYATTSIVLRILWSLKLHHYVNVRIPSGGVIIHRTFAFYIFLDPLQILPVQVLYTFFIIMFDVFSMIYSSSFWRPLVLQTRSFRRHLQVASATSGRWHSQLRTSSRNSADEFFSSHEKYCFTFWNSI